jgi:hypothetical protein
VGGIAANFDPNINVNVTPLKFRLDREIPALHEREYSGTTLLPSKDPFNRKRFTAIQETSIVQAEVVVSYRIANSLLIGHPCLLPLSCGIAQASFPG